MSDEYEEMPKEFKETILKTHPELSLMVKKYLGWYAKSGFNVSHFSNLDKLFYCVLTRKPNRCPVCFIHFVYNDLGDLEKESIRHIRQCHIDILYDS